MSSELDFEDEDDYLSSIFTEAELAAYDEARKKQKELQDEWIRKRLDLEMLTQYGDEDQTAEEWQAIVITQCKADIFFFFDYFAWTFDPRLPPGEQEIPLILYEFQRKLVIWLLENIRVTQNTIERRNLLIEKSRDMGASWVIFYVLLYLMIFEKSNSLIGSRKEEEVDKKGDMDTPLEKIRFAMRHLPAFLLPAGWNSRDHAGFLLIRNPEGGQIVGESANPEFGRGGRSVIVVLDEFPVWLVDDSAWKACAGSTKVRLAIGTPKGPHNKFANLANPPADKKGTEVVLKMRLHWSLHPVKSAGSKRDASGKLTSPWYEEEKRTLSAEDVASELDINYEKSTKGQVFEDYIPEFAPVGHRFKDLTPIDKVPIIRCWDPGRTWAVLFMQVDPYRRVLCLQEQIFDDARIHDVAEEIIRISETEYRHFDFIDCGDPAGRHRVSAAQEDPEFIILANEYDIDVDYTFMSEMPSSLRVKNRITAIHGKLKEMVYQTKTPGLLIDSDRCPKLDEALRSKYRYRVNKYTKQVMDQIDEEHPWEDVVDCLGMGILYRLGLSTKPSSTQVSVAQGSVSWRQGIRRGRR